MGRTAGVNPAVRCPLPYTGLRTPRARRGTPRPAAGPPPGKDPAPGHPPTPDGAPTRRGPTPAHLPAECGRPGRDPREPAGAAARTVPLRRPAPPARPPDRPGLGRAARPGRLHRPAEKP